MMLLMVAGRHDNSYMEGNGCTCSYKEHYFSYIQRTLLALIVTFHLKHERHDHDNGIVYLSVLEALVSV